MYEARQNKEAISRQIQAGARLRVQFKDNRRNPIQKVDIASQTIHCPNLYDALALGTAIHGIIIGNYLGWGYAGTGNQRVSGKVVPNLHRPDLELMDGGGNIIRYGEVKPLGQENAGGQQITAVNNDAANNLNLAHQVNVPRWASQVRIPINLLDPQGSTNDGTNSISLTQDQTYRGLYIYHG